MIEFEKDDDDNSHIDFISSSANLRAENYSLQNMDWLTVKLKAGKVKILNLYYIYYLWYYLD